MERIFFGNGSSMTYGNNKYVVTRWQIANQFKCSFCLIRIDYIRIDYIVRNSDSHIQGKAISNCSKLKYTKLSTRKLNYKIREPPNSEIFMIPIIWFSSMLWKQPPPCLAFSLMKEWSIPSRLHGTGIPSTLISLEQQIHNNTFHDQRLMNLQYLPRISYSNSKSCARRKWFYNSKEY